jgi:hypothetical protein
MKISALVVVLLAATCPHALPAQGAPGAATDLPESRTTTAGDAARNAWVSYQNTVADALIESDRPRDWMLAANMLVFFAEDGRNTPSHASRDELLERAARSAPDDVLVQWTVAIDRSDNSACVMKTTPDENIEALTQLEPDNAASWMMALTLASKRNNSTLMDDALAHMASSIRYNDHFADTMHAWLEAYDRFPPSSDLLQAADSASELPRTTTAALQSMISFTSAFAQTTATALPAYQELTTACKPGKSNNDNWQRYAYCEDAGRLMLDKGNTLIARSIGFAILRNLGASTASDQQEKRNLIWYTEMGVGASGYTSRDYAVVAAHESDWRAFDDEIEIAKRGLRRAGLPDEAPVGWAGSSWSARNAPSE